MGGASAGALRSPGPGLVSGMTQDQIFDRLNEWGIARDCDLQELTDNLVQTQAVLSATFEQARTALMSIVTDFRTESELMRQNSYAEAAQGLARLELVVTEARSRFDSQEAGFTRNLIELDRRQQAVETWAQAQPARAAAATQAAPAPTPVEVRSPGGTLLSFYPGGPVQGVALPQATSGYTTPPQRPAQQHDAWGTWAAGRGASPQGQPSQQHDAGTWTADRGVSPQGQSSQQPPQDAWAAAAAAQQQSRQPGEPPRHSFSGPLGGDGGKPREMRLDARGWGASQPKLDVGMPVDGFQIWKDRATMFLSRDRPDVRMLLGYKGSQVQWKEVTRGL